MLLNPIYEISVESLDGISAVEIQVPAGAVKSDLTGFPFRVNLARMPAGFWVNVRPDGGNLRAYQADGVTMVPHDLTYIDTETETGQFYIKVNLLTASANTFVIGVLDTSEVKLAATDPNGRNAVWNDYEVVVVFPEKINRVDGSAPTVNPTIPTWKWQEVDYLNIATNQGVAFDGTHYFTTSTTTIRKFDITGVEVDISTPLVAFQTATGDATLNHLGALSIIDDELWIPIQQYPASPYDSQFIGRFSKATLDYIGFITLTGATRESSGVHYDAGLDRLYVTDFTIDTNIPYFNKTTGAYVGQLTLSSSIENMQGMTELDGKYYVNSGGFGIYEIEKNGTVNGLIYKSPWSGDDESVFAYGNRLIISQDSSRVMWIQKNPDFIDWGRLNGTPIAFHLPKSTVWSMGVSWIPSQTTGYTQQGIVSIGAVSAPTTDRHTGGYDDPASNGFGMWNVTNGWLYPSPNREAPVMKGKHRVAFAQNGSLARKMRVDHLRGSAGSSSERPVDSGDMRFDIGSSGGTELGYGFYQFGWLRNEYISDQWLEADYENARQEECFYHVLPHPVSAFPEAYTFLSTVNENFWGNANDWVNETPSQIGGLGNLTDTNRWVVGTDASKLKVYQKKRIRSTQFMAVDAGNATITFSSDMATFTGDSDWVTAFAEFYDEIGEFLGRVSSAVVATDAGPGFSNVVTSADRVVPPGTRTIHFGWQSGRRTGSELSVYVRDFDATLDDNAPYSDAVVVWAENDADATGWIATAGVVSVLGGKADTDIPPGGGNHDSYYGGVVSRTTYYKDFSLPVGWAAKVATGGVQFMFRASTFNINDDDDVGIRISFVGSDDGVVDIGLPTTTSQLIPYELTGLVPVAATAIRVQFDFLRQDGTANDGSVGQPSLMLLEPSDPLISFVEFVQNEWFSTTAAAYPPAQAMSTQGAPSISTVVAHDDLATLLLDGNSSVLITGSGTALSVANSTDFCMEMWWRCTEVAANQNTLLSKRDGGGAEEFSLQFNGDRTFLFATFNGGSVNKQVNTDTILSINTWYHVAVVRESRQLRLYVNGVVQADVETETVNPSANSKEIGIGEDGFSAARRFNGNIGPVRLTYGHHRYSGNFTSPRFFPIT